MTTPCIYVGPTPEPLLREAVTAAGGRIADDPAHATAIVWSGGSPADFAAVDHDGIAWVQLPAAGVERWVRSAALHEGKIFTSATGSYAEAVAEHAFALILAGIRRVPEMARRRSWERMSAGTLFDTTVGIVGCGGIGRALLPMLEPFRVRVLAITRSGEPVPGAARTLTPDHLGEVLGESRVVVIGAPATPETRHLIGRHELELMREDALLVNIARGSLIDTDALVAALDAGTIGGAGLDVTDPEPLPDGHPLWAQHRALISPHSANPRHLQLPQLARRVHENVVRFRTGQPLRGVIDTSRGY